MSVSEFEIVCLAGLLHDLGKFWQRTQRVRTSHEEYGRRFVEQEFRGYFMPCGDDLAHAIAHHHQPRLTRDIEKQVALADRLSANEREKEDRSQEEPACTPLLAVLSRPPIAPQGTAEKAFPLCTLSSDSADAVFPTESAAAGPDGYRTLWDGFRAEFASLVGERGYRSADFATLAALLRKYTSRMPSATPWEGDGRRTVPDISLYDHLKTTAAIAACVARELGPDELDPLLFAVAAREPEHGELLDKPLCALLKGDLSGTQDFLYLLTSKGAARGLRGRSFYLQLLTETIASWLLRQFQLPVTNLLFVGGGHFYLLLPHRETETGIAELRRQIAAKLWDGHRGDLSLTLDFMGVAARDFLDTEAGGRAFAAKWDEVSRKVNERKLRRWHDLGSQTMHDNLFTPQEKGGVERCCDVCRNEGTLEEEDGVFKCRRCLGYEDLGRKLRDPKLFVVLHVEEKELPVDAAWHDVLRSFGTQARLCNTLSEIVPGSTNAATVYSLDSADFLVDAPPEWDDLPVSFDFRWLADATPRRDDGQVADFADLAKAADGVAWLGVLRMDVDDLGDLFKNRLGGQGTVSRMTTLSESLRLFFEGWVPRLCREENLAPETVPRVYLTYAGGDDLFVVGSWSVLPELAQKIRDDFRRFVGGDHVTLSAGIAIEHQKYPLYQLANDAKQALDQGAKEFTRKPEGWPKDAICFLRTTCGWEQFRCLAKWSNGLVAMLRPPDLTAPLPRGFLGRLGEIHNAYVENLRRQRRRERLGEITMQQMKEDIAYSNWLWHLVYQLSRFGERQQHFQDRLREFQSAIVQDGLIDSLHVTARWAELLTKE